MHIEDIDPYVSKIIRIIGFQVIRLQRVLENGIGVHHSGILPLLKEIVEMLFQSGFVSIIYYNRVLDLVCTA